VLWWAYWRGWRPAGPVAVALVTLMVAAALPEPYVTASTHFILLLPPIMALLLAGPLTIALSGFGGLALMLWRAGGAGPYANPETWIAFALLIGALALGRQAFDTAQRRAELQARQAQAARDEAEASAVAVRFQAQLLDVVERAVVAVDPAGRVTYWNRFAESLLGWPAAAAQGRTLDELVRLPLTEARQAERAAALARGESWAGEVDAERRDGRRLPLMLHLTPLPGPAGGAVLVAHDIAERRQAEAALRESETRFRALIEHSADLIAVLDETTRMTYIGPSVRTVLGYSEDELLGRSPFEYIHPDDAYLSRDVLPLFLSEPGHILSLEQRLQHQDGRWLWFEGTITNLLHVPGVRGLVVNCRDVTARHTADDEVRRLNAELEARVQQRTLELSAANRELEAFSYSVSHDLRQPLRAINGFAARLAEQRDRLDEPAQAWLDRVRAAGQRMSQLIDDLLALAQVARGEVRRAPVDLSALAEQAAANLRALYPERPMQCLIAPGLTAECDASLIQIVLDNLLGNAYKFTARCPSARVEFVGLTAAEAAPPIGAPPLAPATPVFVVRDNGAGFDMRYADKLFGAFQRLHTEAEFPGSGVGLATVQRIVLRHGGRVWAVSAPGEGAAFYFTLGGGGGHGAGK
jgi:PAS domain S-box-containing protein